MPIGNNLVIEEDTKSVQKWVQLLSQTGNSGIYIYSVLHSSNHEIIEFKNRYTHCKPELPNRVLSIWNAFKTVDIDLIVRWHGVAPHETCVYFHHWLAECQPQHRQHSKGGEHLGWTCLGLYGRCPTGV